MSFTPFYKEKDDIPAYRVDKANSEYRGELYMTFVLMYLRPF